ncbi:uncharacterized protein LOC112349545 [Selaginella moellendorffii]|uniref:uncharacterized protein LOC112349545 n=1 Tax=Selaginella moellendorffii TaxID=88036 RepID=UPI000D1C210A|nr:uncharacterized protein LOC112349545 [Selaginella moellendorffii]|eukprot:XP_024539904.1 uncharacterized protein LOC112349545 [Selaginella moellendorffii]
MGAVTTAVIAIAGILLGWAAIEMACKPCLERGRSSLAKSLNPDYDPDDELDAQRPAVTKKDEEEEEGDGDRGIEELEAGGSASIDDEKKPLTKK